MYVGRPKVAPALGAALTVALFPLTAVAGSNGSPTEVSPSATRIAGDNRYDTAAQVAQRWAGAADTAYLVNGVTFPDALTASSLAGSDGAPVLLTRAEALPADTAAALDDLAPSRIVVVGGESAVSRDVLAGLKKRTGSAKVLRVEGNDRYATAAALAQRYDRADTVYLASGQNFPDALAGAPLAGHDGAPLLLTKGGQLPEATRAALASLKPKRVVILGGKATISHEVSQAVARYTDDVERVSGANRYETAAEIAKRFRTSSPGAVVASGRAFPDALVGGAVAGARGAPVILTQPERLPAVSATAMSESNKERAYVLGGRASVRDSVVQELAELLGDPPAGGLPDRLFAADSFWYQQLPDDTPTDPRSTEVVPWLREVGVESWGNKERNLPSMTINTHAYTPTIYTTGAADPQVTVQWENCHGQPAPDPGLLEQFQDVRIPADAVPGGGSDGHMTLYDATTDRYTDLWLAKKTGGTWSACWGGSIENASENTGYFPAPYGATAAGLPMEAGAIKADELAAGEINHALAMSIPVKAVNSTISWPAQRTDGQSAEPLAISEGQRLRLPSSLDLDSLNLNPATRAVAEAAQTYGIVVIDRSGAFTFHAESPLAMETNPYPDLFGGLENYSVLWGNPHKDEDPFPFSELEVLPVNYGQ